MRKNLALIGIILIFTLFLGCTSGGDNTPAIESELQDVAVTNGDTEPSAITSDNDIEATASVTIDSVLIKFREVRKYGNMPDGYVFDIEAYGHASGPVGAVVWTKINTPTPIEFQDRKIQAPSWTSIENSSFQRTENQPETTNWIAMYPGFEIHADRFDGWYNVADFTVRVQQGQYGTIIAEETRTITCKRSDAPE